MALQRHESMCFLSYEKVRMAMEKNARVSQQHFTPLEEEPRERAALMAGAGDLPSPMSGELVVSDNPLPAPDTSIREHVLVQQEESSSPPPPRHHIEEVVAAQPHPPKELKRYYEPQKAKNKKRKSNDLEEIPQQKGKHRYFLGIPSDESDTCSD
jgi:hypothetical protein